jgi:hypothetical protein
MTARRQERLRRKASSSDGGRGRTDCINHSDLLTQSALCRVFEAFLRPPSCRRAVIHALLNFPSRKKHAVCSATSAENSIAVCEVGRTR